ncbi:MAG TPA: type IV secretion system DNA-binding domain-containing protein [Solirubrobacteraceae bacterium]|nr:type IV secretion system DNA-binding domain-containing protein [Solirubrobacteraceae bacterium]
MLIYWGVPVCALAAMLFVRRPALDWTTGIAVALLVLPFAAGPAIGCVAGSALAWGRRTRRSKPAGAITIGEDRGRRPVAIPLGRTSGSHTLIVGATGSGKTVTEALIVARAIEQGFGAVIVDPKGDALLRECARDAARHARRAFVEWTPSGPTTYNPYGHGTAGEIADKALAGEHYSEPHYLRQAQRYLAHAVRALDAVGERATPARLLELMDPRRLELLARSVPDQADARRLFDYLDALDARQRTGLGGTRDRLAILAESELGRWLHPTAGVPELDLLEAVRGGAVSYLCLEADRLPLLSRMLAAAIVGDLLTVAASCQAAPVPTLVAIDEFSAIAAEGVARLFGRARAAGFNLLLATQELADLRAAAPELLEQVLGNVETVIAHRQSVPDSAELIARIAGTKPAWSSSEQLAHAIPTGRTTRSRSREFAIHPDVIRTLACGSAAVSVASAGCCSVARILHP